MEEGSGGVSDAGEFGDGLDDAGFVVGEDDTDQPGVGAERGFERGGLDESLWGAREKGHIDISCGQRLRGVEDGVMLGGSGDEVRLFATV